MNKTSIHVAIHNFFISLILIPTIIHKFITTWLPINQTVNKATKTFNQQLSKTSLPQHTTKTLTKEYTTIKDYIFEAHLNKKTKTHTTNTKKTSSPKRVLTKMLPGGQVFLRIKNNKTKDVKSAILLDATKTIILIVAVTRALKGDIYWVTVCITSYILYSLLFGIASELINKYKNISKGLLGSIINTTQEALSDTKVIALVSLALSSHAILAAPFVPLYHVIPGLDFVEHYISGFGIGLFAVKTYRTFLTHISYSKTLTIIGSTKLSHQISLFETNGELPFLCYSSIFVGFIWEGLEEIVENFTPRVINIFFWNGVADIFMNLLGALTAYTLVSYSFIIKKQKTHSNPNEKNTKIDPQAVQKASNIVLTHMKNAIDTVYSENAAKDAGTYQLTRMNKAC